MVMKLPRWPSSVLVWLALLCQFCAAQASPPSSSPLLRLTLKEAVQLALKQNPQRIAAHLLTLESERDRQIARAALLPQAGLIGNTSLNNYNIQSFEKAQPKAAGPYQYIEPSSTCRRFAPSKLAAKA